MRWGGIFDVDTKLSEIRLEEEKTLAPNFWDDPKKAEILLKSIQTKKNWTSTYEALNKAFEDLTVLYDFFKEGEITNVFKMSKKQVVGYIDKVLDSKATEGLEKIINKIDTYNKKNAKMIKTIQSFGKKSG